MKKDNLFWGIFFILAAVLLILGQFNFFSGFSLFRILFTILLLCWLVYSIPRRDFGGILFSIAFLCILFDDFLGIENLTPWPVLGAAALASIGLSMIFKKPYEKIGNTANGSVYVERPHNQSENSQSSSAAKEEFHGNDFHFNSIFSSTEKHIHSDNFTSAFIKNSCGKIVIYLDDAIIQQQNAQITVDITFASADLYIPKTWNVINHASSAFGSILEKNTACSNGTPTLTIIGNVFCGCVNIFYI